jgi:hypothetical protein
MADDSDATVVCNREQVYLAALAHCEMALQYFKSLGHSDQVLKAAGLEFFVMNELTQKRGHTVKEEDGGLRVYNVDGGRVAFFANLDDRANLAASQDRR